MDDWERVMLMSCGAMRDCIAPPGEHLRQICRPLGDKCDRCTTETEFDKDALTGKTRGPICTVRIADREQKMEHSEALVFGQARPKQSRRRVK